MAKKDSRRIKIIALIIALVLMSLVLVPEFLSNFAGNAIDQRCLDSDGGKNFNIAGTVTQIIVDKSKDYSDVCSGNVLTEYYCGPNALSSDSICPYGCADGACMPKSTYYADRETANVYIPKSACTNVCYPSGRLACSSSEPSTSYMTCGDYNHDACYEWSEPVECASGQICVGEGLCVKG